jgi:predicted transcriptional regulator
MLLMAHDLAHGIKDIHFTIPESIWESHGSFYRGFGFLMHGVAGTSYRNGEKEVFCTTGISRFMQACQERIRNLSWVSRQGRANGVPELVLSVAPAFAERILLGQKKVELRRRFSSKLAGSTIAIYATRPVSRIVATAKVSEVVRGPKAVVWERFGRDSGCSHEEFMDYCDGVSDVSALRLAEVASPAIHMAREDVEDYLDTQVLPPVSYCRNTIKSKWTLPFVIEAALSAPASRTPS